MSPYDAVEFAQVLGTLAGVMLGAGLAFAATYANERTKVIRDQVLARVPGVENGRYYDGLVENPDGTYTGLEVKSGNASKNANQKAFDGAISPDNPATATLNGKPIKITDVQDLKG